MNVTPFVFNHIRNVMFILLLILSGCNANEKTTKTEKPSTPIQLPEIINGHKLPPEPDPKINNTTLLGIDSNNNGVRDDVERWIYKTYKDKHPIHIDIAMQAGRSYKKVLATPERAKEIQEEVNAAQYCNWYYQNDVEDLGKKVLVYERIDALVKSKYFNTKDRSDVYWQYDKLLSGDSYKLPRMKERKAFCDFDTSKYNKK